MMMKREKTANLYGEGFYINLPCGLVVALCLFFISLPENSSSDTKPKQQSLSDYLKQLDLLGFSIFAVSSTQVLLALNWGGTKSAWNSATVIGLFCGSGGALIAFVVWEGWMGREAMIPFALVKRQVVWSSCINYGCFAGCLLTSSYYLPIYFQAVRGASPTMSGVDLLPSILGNMIFAMLTGSLCTIYCLEVAYSSPLDFPIHSTFPTVYTILCQHLLINLPPTQLAVLAINFPSALKAAY